MNVKMFPIPSMKKVFPDEAPTAGYEKATCLKNEVFSFQFAVYVDREDDGSMPRQASYAVSLESDLPASVRLVGLEPVTMVTYPQGQAECAPEEYLRLAPGMFPDPLLPLEKETKLISLRWYTFWVTVDGREGLEEGEHTLTLKLAAGEEESKCSFDLTVLPASLPVQSLKYTEWFHCDCIAKAYGVEMMSEAHWNLIEKFARTAVENGINMLLTPVITPALDTAVGTERPTMQLVRVDVTPDGYAFDFTNLDRWFAMCDRVGVMYYEIAHLFSQWGAKFAPKVMGWMDGEYTRLFGWETDALSDEYTGFLDCFLPALVAHLKETGRFDRCYFHLSDEPNWLDSEHYKACRKVLLPYLPEERLMDALSQVEFWDEGVVKLPIPANNHIRPFLDRKIDTLWTYYCCGQYMGVSNKFLGHPGATTRIIGAQMFKYNISGFLQWGYNYWYSALSLSQIDPWRTCEGNSDWPSGDPFCVYPGPDGPVESMRLVLMHEGIQDYSAMQALEAKIGHEAVVAMIDEGIEPLEFDKFPRDEAYLLNLREKINAALCK